MAGKQANDMDLPAVRRAWRKLIVGHDTERKSIRPLAKLNGDFIVNMQQSVFLVGGTGRTGRCVLKQLLDRGINVRIVVRSTQKLSQDVIKSPNLTVVEANLLSLSNEDLQRHINGCDAVISCLGHVISLKGVFGSPRDLVTQITKKLCQAIETQKPVKPVKFILMNSVSVNHPGDLDTRRKMFEKAFVWIIRGLIPPAKDNQQAANFLYDHIGMNNPFVQWVAVRPDTLLEGGITEYTLYENLVSSLFAPDSTNMPNVAHFMCELVTNQKVWNDWKGKLPVIIDASTEPAARADGEGAPKKHSGYMGAS